jgi:FAD/FMN-containing dehydrogenase
MAIKTVTTERGAACQELKEKIGAEKVRDDEITRVTYGRVCHGFDVMIPFRKPCFVVFPETREDVVETLKLANKYIIPVTPVGTAAIATGTTEDGIILDQRRRDKIIEINTDSGYVVIEPGVSFDKLTSALRGTGFKCSVGTMPGPGTVLGQALGRGSQSFSTRYLSLVIDLEVVLPDGTVFNTGSSHFEGVGSHLEYGPHPDLSGLYTCGYGTMGVITKAAIRIHPENEAYKVHLAGFNSYSDAIDYVKDIINKNIPEHTFIWNWHMYLTWPLDPDGIATVMPEILKSDFRKPPEGIPYNIVSSMISGPRKVVEAQLEVCEDVAKKYHGRVISDEEAKKRFPATLDGFQQQYGNFSYREGTHWCQGRFTGLLVFGEPKDMKEVEKYAVNEFATFGKGINPINYYSHPFDFGRSFLLRIAGFPDPSDTETRMKMMKKFGEMYDTAIKKYRAVPIAPIGMAERVGTYMDVLIRIKKALDPNNILSRDSGVFDQGQISIGGLAFQKK